MSSVYQPDLAVEGAGDQPPAIIAGSFPGIAQTTSYPPDPVISAGPHHIVEMVNRTISICDKYGNVLKSVEATDWFSPVLPGALPFDPRIQYDHFAGRWIMLWHHVSGDALSSFFLLSVSDTDDPTGTWKSWALPANVNGSSPSGNWADNGCLGFDTSAVYITSDQFTPAGSFDYAKIRIVPKGPLLSVTADSIHWTDFWGITEPSSRPAYRVRPTVEHTASSDYFLVEATTLLSGDHAVLYRITNPATTPVLTMVEVPLSPWDATSEAKQPGGGVPLEIPEANLMSEAHFQHGLIWATHTVANPVSGNYSAIRYFCISTATGKAVEDVTFGASGWWYFYPAIIVDKDDNVALTFTRSGTGQYPGAYYTGKLAGAGHPLRPSVQMHRGLAHYQKVDAEGNRWGDYNSIALDPADGNTFWCMTEYASTPANTWGTWVMGARLVPFPDARVSVNPLVFNFGAQRASPNVTSAQFTVRNNGLAPLTVTGTGSLTSAFQLVNPPGWPRLISSSDSLVLTLKFAPTGVGTFSDSLVISSSDAVRPHMRIPLSGSGVTLAAAEPRKIYAVASDQSSSQLYTLNAQTGVATLIGDMGIPYVIAITARSSNRQLYAIAPDSGGTVLSLVDAATGHSYPARVLERTDFSAFDFGLGDTLIAGTISGGLYRMDLTRTTADRWSQRDGFEYSAVGRTRSGRLWTAAGSPLSNDTLCEINRTTGATQAVGRTGWSIFTSALCGAPDGSLLGLIEGSLFRLDTLTGHGTFLNLFTVNGLRGIATVTDTTATSVPQQSPTSLPLAFSLQQNYPNPFNPVTGIRYQVSGVNGQSSVVSLKVYDLLGREVTVLVNEAKAPGTYSATFSGSGLASGVYLYRLQAGSFTETKKLMLLK